MINNHIQLLADILNMFKINEENYEHYKMIFKVIWEFEERYSSLDLNPEYSPLSVLENWERKSSSLARKGLNEGLRDSLTALKDLPNSSKVELNNELISKKLPSINILISRIKNVPKKVLEKGIIKNLDEYYVVREVLSDVDYEIAASRRKGLNKLLAEFEKNYKEKNAS